MISRRSFLKNSGLFLVLSSTPGFSRKLFEPLVLVNNPLVSYPNRGWEKIYRDIYKPDETTVILCNPNDTHGCYLNAYIKNGIITRLEPTYNEGMEDLFANRVGISIVFMLLGYTITIFVSSFGFLYRGEFVETYQKIFGTVGLVYMLVYVIRVFLVS